MGIFRYLRDRDISLGAETMGRCDSEFIGIYRRTRDDISAGDSTAMNIHKLGGKAVVKKYGRGYMRMLGKKGGLAKSKNNKKLCPDDPDHRDCTHKE